MVRTCSKSTMESFCRPVRSAWSAMCVGRFVLSRWLVMAAAITVGLNRLPTSFCTISTGARRPARCPPRGLNLRSKYRLCVHSRFSHSEQNLHQRPRRYLYSCPFFRRLNTPVPFYYKVVCSVQNAQDLFALDLQKDLRQFFDEVCRQHTVLRKRFGAKVTRPHRECTRRNMPLQTAAYSARTAHL